MHHSASVRHIPPDISPTSGREYPGEYVQWEMSGSQLCDVISIRAVIHVSFAFVACASKPRSTCTCTALLIFATDCRPRHNHCETGRSVAPPRYRSASLIGRNSGVSALGSGYDISTCTSGISTRTCQGGWSITHTHTHTHIVHFPRVWLRFCYFCYLVPGQEQCLVSIMIV